MFKLQYFFAIILLIALPLNSWAKPAKSHAAATATANKAKPDPALNIAAVVGDQIISSFDVDARIKFIVATTQISNSPEVLKNIRPQVIHSLIDEALQRQMAKKDGIVVNDAEITRAVSNIETQRGMQTGSIASTLVANNVPERTFVEQVRAQLSWNKWLGKNVLPTIKVSDEDVAIAKKNFVAEPNASEMEISLIALPVEKAKAEADVKKISDYLVGELNKGAKFEEVARQFSANDGGKPFWVSPQQLDPNIAAILKTKKEGEITSPIRTKDGFSIIKILHIRAASNETGNAEVAAVDEDKIREALMRQKFELEAQKNLRNLRRDTFIEVRE